MHAEFAQAKDRGHDDAEDQGHKRGRDAMEVVLQQQHDDDRADADDQRQQMRFRQVDHQFVEALPHVAGASLDAEQLGQLLDRNDHRQTRDEARQHRRREELGDAAQVQQAGENGHKAHGDRQRRGEHDELGGSGGARADTIENDMTACTEDAPTTNWRDVPKMA